MKRKPLSERLLAIMDYASNLPACSIRDLKRAARLLAPKKRKPKYAVKLVA